MEAYFTALGLSPTQTSNAQGDIFDRAALAIRLRPLLDAWLQGDGPRCGTCAVPLSSPPSVRSLH
eukprot:11171564-Alexandrium_andersonii.AAC.1